MGNSPGSGGIRPGAGQVLLGLGLIGFGAGFAQRLGAPLPYYCGEWMLILLFLGTTIAGASLTWKDDHPRTRWTPARPGRRFTSAVLYTREGCHLCDEALDLLAEYSDYLPETVAVDIDTDDDLHERFDTSVPVVEFDGQVRFRGTISERMLRRLIEGTPPLPE